PWCKLDQSTGRVRRSLPGTAGRQSVPRSICANEWIDVQYLHRLGDVSSAYQSDSATPMEFWSAAANEGMAYRCQLPGHSHPASLGRTPAQSCSLRSWRDTQQHQPASCTVSAEPD